MKQFKNVVSSFVADESGQDLIEYSLIAALLSLAAVSSLRSLADAVNGVFGAISTDLTGAI